MRVLTVVLVATLLTACTSRTAAVEDEVAALPALAAGSVEEVGTPVGFAPTHFPRDMAGGAYEEGRGYLLGPHFALRLAWRATGPALTEDAALLLGPMVGLDAARAADGQEVLVVATDADFRGGPWDVERRVEAPPAAELVVDGKATALERLPLTPSGGLVQVPEGGALFMASVPKEAPVSIRVTDAGRTQTLDVRTGERGKDAVDLRYGDMPAPVDVAAGVATPAGTFPLTLTVGFPPSLGSADTPSALLSPYRPSNGWAKDGRAWLVVPRPEATAPIAAGTPLYHLEVADTAVFALRLPDGTVTPALPGSSTMYVSVDGITPGNDDADVVFEVPADLTEGVFLTSLGAATVVASAAGGEWAGTWAPAPAAAEAPIAL